MKPFYKTALTLLTVVALTACDKEEIERYDTGYNALNIWFGTAYTVNDNESFNYSYSSGEQPVTFYARISGMPADHDREFSIEPAGGDFDKAGNSYRFETYTIKAGETSGEFKFYLDSSKLPSSTAFSDKDGELVFRMAENSNFNKGAEGQNELHLIVRNFLNIPEEWNVTENALYQPYSRYFGPYSTAKYRFMIEKTGLRDFRIYYNASKPYDETNNLISPAYATYLQQLLKVELAKYNETHDTPLCDDLGNPITF